MKHLSVAALDFQGPAIVCANAGDITGMRNIARATVAGGHFDCAFDHLHRRAVGIDCHAERRSFDDSGKIRCLHGKMRLCAFADAVDGVAEIFEQLCQAISAGGRGNLDPRIWRHHGVFFAAHQHGTGIRASDHDVARHDMTIAQCHLIVPGMHYGNAGRRFRYGPDRFVSHRRPGPQRHG